MGRTHTIPFALFTPHHGLDKLNSAYGVYEGTPIGIVHELN